MTASSTHALSFFKTLDGRGLTNVIEISRQRNRAERARTGRVSQGNLSYLFLAIQELESR